MEEALKKAIWLLTTPAEEEVNDKARKLAQEATDDAIQKYLERRVADLTFRLDKVLAVLASAVAP